MTGLAVTTTARQKTGLQVIQNEHSKRLTRRVALGEMGLVLIASPSSLAADPTITDRVIIAYSTVEGQTERISKRIGRTLSRETGCEVQLWNIRQPGENVLE